VSYNIIARNLIYNFFQLKGIEKVPKNVTMRDVAERAGVSIATVSHVINKTRHVNKQTRDTVMNAMDEMGYMVAASTPRKDTSSLIGLIIADIREDFYTEIVKAAETTACENGYSLILCDAEDDDQKELFYIQMLLKQNVQGIILAPIKHTSPPSILKEANLPVVLIDRCYQKQNYDFIGINNYAAGREATLHLSRHGAQRIGFIGYDDSVYTIQQRILGYLDAIEETSPGKDGQVLRLKYHKDRSTSKIAALVRDYKLDGLVCGTSHACYETISAIREHDIRIPEDVQIITFDENKWFDYLSFPLSVVQQPTPEIGALAVELIINKLRSQVRMKREPRKLLLDFEIISR
jgi:LacI family transcriptional regulator